MNVLCFFVFMYISSCYGSPKKYIPEDGFRPTNRYQEVHLPHANSSTKIEDKEGKESSERLRFGIPLSTYGNTGVGVQYGASNGVVLSPMKIDIGGIALGALIGLGAVLIVPKLASVLSGGYGYRSLENDVGSVTDVLARIDNSLEQHNIDSSSCVQKIICNYVIEAQSNIKNGEANTLDQLIHSLTNNTFISYMLNGIAVKEAIEMGREGNIEKCSSLYQKCPVTQENVMKVIASLLPA